MKVGLGLRGQALVTLAIGASVGGLVAWLAVAPWVGQAVRAQLRQRAALVVQAVSSSGDIGMAVQESELAIPFGSGDTAQQVLRELVEADDALVYALVLDSKRTPVVWAASAAASDGDLLATDAVRRQLVAEHEAKLGDDDLVRLIVPIVGDRDQPDDETEPALARRAPPLVLIAASPAVELERLQRTLAAGLGIAATVIALSFWILFGWLFRRVFRLEGYARELAAGDLTRRLGEVRGDELGRLGGALESITQNLGETISRVRVAALETANLSAQVDSVAQQIGRDASTQVGAVRQTDQALAAMSQSSQVVETRLEELGKATESGAARLEQISAAVQTIAGSVEQSAAGVEQARAQVRANEAALLGANQVVDQLNEVVDGTATATTEITASIRSVNEHAEKALAASSHAAKQAEKGVAAVQETRGGIDEIRGFTNRAVESIHFLTDKVASVEQILDVIADIANQTRLLSLNASIIAAQAGEHGRGFLVVADEIKALAAKTSRSTHEIGEVIREVLSVSGKVIDVVEKGVATVDEALARSANATEVLGQVLSSAEQSGNLVRGIAKAMAEQSRGAQRVDQAMQEVAGTSGRLRQLVIDQQLTGSQLQESIQRMRDLMDASLGVARQQATEIDHALRATAGLLTQLGEIGAQTREQAETREALTMAFAVLTKISARNLESARLLAAAVNRASAQSAALGQAVEVFRT